jgi:hypothetical protein
MVEIAHCKSMGRERDCREEEKKAFGEKKLSPGRTFSRISFVSI